MGIVKKIMCSFLIIIMLLNSCFTTIQVFADELGNNGNNMGEPGPEEPGGKLLLPPLGGTPNGGVKPTTKDNLTPKMKNDEYEINQFKTQFVSGAELDENGNLVWTPDNFSEGHEFTFRVNYAVSGLKELPPEAIQITIPKSILRNKSGNLDDYYQMSLPTKEEFDGSTEFAYIESGDYIVVYNPNEVEAGINGYFEILYATKSLTFEYKDYDAKNTQLITEGGTASDPFYAIININTGNDELKGISDDKNLFINTKARIESTQKKYPTIYRSWEPSWMETEPADKDDYYYLIWEIRTEIEKDVTQKYNFSLEDVVTDLTEGLNGEDYQIVGYKFSGQKHYTDQCIQSNQTLDGARYDYVLTRHKISTYSNRKYTLKNSVTATVDPIDQVDEDTKAASSNTFFWDPTFEQPTGHFDLEKTGNNNWINKFGYYWDYANYDLDKFQKGEINELEGFKYHTETKGYAYPWTLKEGGLPENPEDYGFNKVTYNTWDDTLYLEEDTVPMSYEDYYLNKLGYTITNFDALYNQFENKFDSTPAVYENDEIIVFYGKFKDSTEWVEIGTYNLGTQEITSNSTYVSKMSKSEIKFNDGVDCVGWKFTTSNKHYSTNIIVEPYITLKNSEYVKTKVANVESLKLQNIVSTKIFDYKENLIYEEDTPAIDYARVTHFASEITKKVLSVANNILSKEYNISWRVNAYETATSGNGMAEYVRQSTGEFYDLIPYGGEVNLNTIQVQTEQGFLPENGYTYDIISNYNNSGRSMLIINIKEQAQYYTVYYTTVHSWENMKDFGRKVLNPVAYETGNEKIYNGYPDDGGNLSDKNKSVYEDLDKNTDANKFIYTEQTFDINAVTAAISGLYKKVKNSNESSYSYYTEVEPSGNYTYQLRYQNDYINTAKDLILFDSLENFKIVNSEEGTTKTGSWKGKLKSIDLNQLYLKGIEPVIYASTVEDLDLEGNNDITNESIWKKISISDDLSNVKAIAIDMTKDIYGNDFVLGSGDSVSVILHMEAPSTVSDEVAENPYTYNNIYIKDVLIDELGGEKEYFIHQDYTTVKYHVVANVPFVKVNEKDENETIKGITFRLYGTSYYNNKVDKYVTSDNAGQVIFKSVEAGEYILQEYETTPDWLEDHTEHIVQITIKGEVYIDGELINDISSKKITNKARIHTDVTVTKRDLVTKVKVSGAKLKLSGTSNYGTEILMYGVSDELGNIKFEDIEYGTYDLVEVEAPEGYILSNEKYKVVIDENGNYDVLTVSESKSVYEKGIYNIYNEPLHSFAIVKCDKYDEKIIVGAKFKLTGVSDYGTKCDMEVQSKAAGLATFEGLEPGTYILQETFVPEGSDGKEKILYQLDENKYIVNIDKFGNTIIDGLEKNENGNFVFYNQRNKGKVTVTKKWVDDSTNEERTEPVIHISTEKPKESKIVYFRDNFDNSNGPLYFINSDYKNLITGSFKRNLDLTEEQVKKINGVVRLDSEYDNSDVEYKIYGWIDENGNCWWWSNAETAIMTDKSNRLFTDLKNVKEIDTSYINTTKVTDMNGMFRNCNLLTELNISKLDTKNVTNMWSMFENCNNLTGLDLSKFDTQKVTAMNSMFSCCNKLKELDLSNFNTSNVKNMRCMFYKCTDLTNVDLSSFNTSNVENMASMFDSCSNLETLNVSSFNTEKVITMDSMFSCCSKLKELDLKNFNTANVNTMRCMFYKCTDLTNVDLSSFNTSNVENMASMFDSCSNLETLNVSSFNTEKVTTMDSMFSCCSKLKELDLKNFDTANVNTMRCMFYNCPELSKVDVTSFDTGNVTNFAWMFNGDGSIEELDVSRFDTSKAETMNAMFAGCRTLSVLNVSNFNTENVTDMSWLFNGCNNVQELNVSNFNTSKVTNMNSMFSECNTVEELDVSKFDTSNVTEFCWMFNGCNNVKELDVSGFNTSKATNMGVMFANCNMVEELDVSGFDTTNVVDMNSMFRFCKNLEELDVSHFDTSNVTNINFMFDSCEKLVELDVSHFNTSKVTNMGAMFASCLSLESVDVSHFDTSNVTEFGWMFNGCNSVKVLDVSHFDTSKAVNMNAMFAGCNVLSVLDVSNFNTENVTDMSLLFNGCKKVQELDVSKFNTSKVTTMGAMFSNCQTVKELDVSSFDTKLVTNTGYMFDGCLLLDTIYVSDKWVMQPDNSENMFLNSTNLVGENGTTYNYDHIDATYACVDTASHPGYLTYKASTISSLKLNKDNVLRKILPNYNVEVSKVAAIKPVILGSNGGGALSYSTSETNYDDNGNEVHWVKNGDTWTYTFYVEDPNATWYAWEDEMNGYNTSCSVIYPEQIKNKEVTVYNYDTSKPLNLNGYGNLEITKRLYEIDPSIGIVSSVPLTTKEDNTEFTIKVILSASDDKKDLISGTKIFGDYIFKDGVTYIKLQADETATITDLPEGISYKVEEEVQGYTVLYLAETGVIKDGQTLKTVVNNYKEKENPNDKDKISFTVEKIVKGNYQNDDEEYIIEIVLDNLDPNTVYTLSDGTTYESDSNGFANVTVKLKNGESVTVKDIPVGAKYKAFEYKGDYVLSYDIKDTNNLGLINNSKAKNTKENIEISTKTETADKGEVITITFISEKNITQNIKIKKTVTSEEDTNTYIFNIEFSGMKKGFSFNSTVGKIIADENGKAELIIYLAGGEEAEFYEIPVGTKYKITELASNTIASYIITDENGINKIVKSGNANSVNRIPLSTEEETIDEGEEVTITFINDTVNQEPDKVTTSLGVKKNVLDIDGKVLEDCEEIFTFEIKAEEGCPIPENSTVTIKGNGEASFGDITFDKTGTYTYTIVENAGELEEYEYDNTVYTIVYEVTNPEGLLELTKTVKRNGFSGDAIEFTNKIYKVDVKLLKVDEKEDPLDGASLQILDNNANVVKEWTTGDENSENAELKIKLAKGIYILREVKAPEGYEKAEDIEFVVNEDGTVSIKDKIVDLVIMKDPKISEKPKEDPPENPQGDPNGNPGEKPQGDPNGNPGEKPKEDPNGNSNGNLNEIPNEEEKKIVENVKTGDAILIYEYILVMAVITISMIKKKK